MVPGVLFRAHHGRAHSVPHRDVVAVDSHKPHSTEQGGPYDGVSPTCHVTLQVMQPYNNDIKLLLLVHTVASCIILYTNYLHDIVKIIMNHQHVKINFNSVFLLDLLAYLYSRGCVCVCVCVCE